MVLILERNFIVFLRFFRPQDELNAKLVKKADLVNEKLRVEIADAKHPRLDQIADPVWSKSMARLYSTMALMHIRTSKLKKS